MRPLSTLGRQGATPAGKRRIFAARLAHRDRAGNKTICLLCLEADPQHCHRTLVAKISHLHLV